MDVENYIAERLLQLCSRTKTSRYQLSQRTGITQSALSDIIKKKTVPTIFTIDKICTAFGISVAQFFTADDKITNLTSEQEEILKMWMDLSPEEKRFIKNCMTSMRNEE